MSANPGSASRAEIDSPLQERVRARFGLLPNFFRLAPETPEITEKLWGFAQSAYLDNPLPSLFKERLFVYLSRFCCVRYCVARHTGFLLGLGRPAGDPDARILTADEVIRLLKQRLCHGSALISSISICAASPLPLVDMPEADSLLEQAIFALASHVFLQTEDAQVCLETLERLLGPVRSEYLIVLLTFVRAAHYWTEVHPKLKLEEDIRELLRTQEELATCILADPEARADIISAYVLEELPELRRKADRKTSLLNSIVAGSEDAIFSTDLNGIITTWNKSAEQLFGHIEPEVVGQHVSLIIPSDQRHEEKAMMDRILRGERLDRLDTVRVRKDGIKLDVSLTVSPIRDAAGTIIGLSIIARDLTRHEQTKAASSHEDARDDSTRSQQSSRANKKSARESAAGKQLA